MTSDWLNVSTSDNELTLMTNTRDESPVKNICHPVSQGNLWSRSCKCLENSKVIIVILCLVSMIQGMVVNGFLSVVISTLEKRYSLTSTQTGLVASGYDIACVLCLIPVSYFGGIGHKPRWIAVGVVLLASGSILFALPHFLSGLYVYPSSRELSLCYNRSSTDLLDSCPTTNHHFQFYIFIAAQVLHGAGATPIYTLAVTYLDENIRAKLIPLYLGIFYTMAIVGPALGYIVGGQLLKIYCDIGMVDIQQVDLKLDDPRWVGAWWIGFILSGCFAILLSLPLFCTPRTVPGVDELRKERISEVYKGTQQVSFAKRPLNGNFLTSVKLLFRNRTFMFLNLAGACEGLLLSGFIVFTPKFVEAQFSISAAWAAQLVGLATIPAGGSGTFIGGYLVKRFQLSFSSTLKLSLIMISVTFCLMLSFLVRCPNTKFAGVTVDYLSSNRSVSQVNLTDECNLNCQCTADDYQPVCASNNIVYFSPCYAGCQYTDMLENRKVYSSCSCVESVNGSSERTAVEGQCLTSCHLLPVFLAIFAVIVFFTFVAGIPAVSATLRCVPESERSFALGIQWILVRCLGMIPAPIIFGAIIDWTCRSWQNSSCDVGSCFVYDNWLMGSYLLTTVLCCKFLSALFFLLALLSYRPPIQPPTLDPNHTTLTTTS